jgi:hypothetical protein
MGNSININNPVCCNTTVTQSSCVVCKHPLEYLIDQIYNSDVNHDISNFIAKATTLLNTGIIASNDAGICCPDCNDKYGFYFLGGLAKFNALAVTFKFNTTSVSCKAPCCLNIYIDKATHAIYSSNIKIKPDCCNTSFTSDVAILGQMINNPALFSAMGLIEFNTIREASSIGTLVTSIAAKYSGITETEWSAIFTALFDTLGIVVKCFDCGIIIASANTFNSWAVANSYNDKSCS